MIDIALLRRLEAAAFAAPWRARTFEMECPCPNGAHCGDSHTCEEVEAPEEYPCGAPGKPAAEGDGQCVVQISVPGLETFSRPNGALIVEMRNALPALCDEVERLRAVVDAARAPAESLARFVEWHERGAQWALTRIEVESIRAESARLGAALAAYDGEVNVAAGRKRNG